MCLTFGIERGGVVTSALTAWSARIARSKLASSCMQFSEQYADRRGSPSLRLKCQLARMQSDFRQRGTIAAASVLRQVEVWPLVQVSDPGWHFCEQLVMMHRSGA